MGSFRPATVTAIALLCIVPESTMSQARSHRALFTSICTLVAAPGNAFTFVAPPRSAPGHQRGPGATFQITYVGFESFPAAQAAFQHAADIWSGLVSSPVPIRILAQFSPLGPSVLGSAGAQFVWRDFPGATVANSWYGDALADKLLGADHYPGEYDVSASFNSSYSNWYFGIDGATPAGQYDFVSVVLHELGHGLGIHGSAMVANGTGSLGWEGYPMIYDRFAVNDTMAPLLGFVSPSADLGARLTYGYNPSDPHGPGVYWAGSGGMTAHGGVTARLYTPSIWASGSSYSHLDDDVFPPGNANSLMTHALSSAEAIHHPGPITLGLLTDMGWTVFTTPGRSHDFDGDGQPDLIFENAAGQRYAWFMNGTTFVGGDFVSPNPVDPDVTIVGVNDFTGDGGADLLVQRQTDRTVTLLKLTGLSIASQQPIQTAANTPWTVAATGDFNGDGQADIAWQNSTTGQIYIWFMTASGGHAGYAGPGGTFSGDYIRDASQNIISLGPTSQQVAGAADMNSDGKTDLIWHDEATGQIRVWYLDGVIRTADVATTPGTVAAGWKIRAVGDYNADNRPDFIWQHTSTGELYAWFMNGVTFSSGSYLSPSRVNTSWKMVGPR